MERFFSPDLPWLEFMRNTLVISLLGLVPLLLLYVFLTPGFAAHLASGGPVLSRFLRQVLTNGLPVVFVANYVCLFIFATIRTECDQAGLYRLLIVIDLPLRAVVFVFLHAVIYALSAEWFGSFGGSKTTALRVVAPTLAQSALFMNISGVYLYATLLAALPVYADLFDRLQSRTSTDTGLASRVTPWALALIVCGAFALGLTGLARLIAWLQS